MAPVSGRAALARPGTEIVPEPFACNTLAEVRRDPGSALAALDELALADRRARIARALVLAREVLNMDIAYFSEFTSSEQVIHGVSGASQTFGFDEGTRVPLRDTFCKRVLDETVPPLVPDARDEPGLRDLDTDTSGNPTGYVSVPIQLASGRVYGTLCAASHGPCHDLDKRDLSFLRVLAYLIADSIDHPPPSGAGAAAHPQIEIEPDRQVVRVALWVICTPRAVRAARRALDPLSEYIGEEALQELHLLVSELVSNAVRHTGLDSSNAVGVEVTVEPSILRALVSDPGPGFDLAAVPKPDPERVGGWGLYLVEQMTDRWGVERDDGARTRVWFEIDRL